METIELTNEFLGMDSEAPGLHRRLLAGLRSVLDRNGDPQYRIEPGDKAMRPYRDYDLVMVMRSGAGEGRRVDGEMRWPLHVGNSGRTSAKGLYTLPSLDLV